MKEEKHAAFLWEVFFVSDLVPYQNELKGFRYNLGCLPYMVCMCLHTCVIYFFYFCGCWGASLQTQNIFRWTRAFADLTHIHTSLQSRTFFFKFLLFIILFFNKRMTDRQIHKRTDMTNTAKNREEIQQNRARC